MLRQGDIVLIPVPFTDLSSQRRRPVIVISNDTYNRKTKDIVVVAMTSNPASVEYSFTIDSSDLKQGTLNRPGKIRVDKIYTLSQSICVQNLWSRYHQCSGSNSQHITKPDRQKALAGEQEI